MADCIIIWNLHRDAGGVAMSDSSVGIEGLARSLGEDEKYVKMPHQLYHALLDAKEHVGEHNLMSVLKLLGNDKVMEIDLLAEMKPTKLVVRNQ